MTNNQFPTRKQIRLSGYDYSQSGYYYVTICTQNRKWLFGNIVNNKMVLNNAGKMIDDCWKTLPKYFPVELDVYQIMPNHLHSIIKIVGINIVGVQFIEPAINCITGAINCAPTGTKPTLGKIIRFFKAKSSRLTNMSGWQRNYYEHIIRNETELNKTREYIKLNPQMWDRDRNNPEN